MFIGRTLPVWGIYIYIYTYTYIRAIQKITSSELLTKQAMRNKVIIYKKILLNIVTAGIEVLIILGK
jgi:hypothetical protein